MPAFFAMIRGASSVKVFAIVTSLS